MFSLIVYIIAGTIKSEMKKQMNKERMKTRIAKFVYILHFLNIFDGKIDKFHNLAVRVGCHLGAIFWRKNIYFGVKFVLI